MQKLRLSQGQCPGDLAVMTMAIESLHITYPDEYITTVRTHHNEMFLHHPRIKRVEGDDVLDVDMHYNLINESHIPFHFGSAYCDTLSQAIKRPLRLRVTRPYLYVLSTELANPQVEGRYALINAGYKDDYRTKWAGSDVYQSIVDEHKDYIQFVQVGHTDHHHPKLRNVIDLVGKTTIRQLMRLCYSAEFGIGGVTALGHFCAAWGKPYVCMIGGREPVSWITYPTQINLSTQNLLPCCKGNACWKSTIDGTDKQKNCELPMVDNHNNRVPTCMLMLKQQAIEAVECLLTPHKMCQPTPFHKVPIC